MRKRAGLPVLLLAIFTLSLSAAFKKEDVKVHTLDNGLKGLLVGDHDTPSVVVGKAADIRPLLAKYGTWQEKKITDPGF